MKTYRKTISVYFVWAAVFIIISLGMVFYFALTNEAGAFSLENMARLISRRNISTLVRSLRIALVTTVLCLALGYPFAYIASRLKLKYQTTAIILIVIPMWMNFLLRTYSWVTILSRNGILNSFLKSLGIQGPDLLFTEGAVILGMVYNFLPFMILPIYTVLEKMDQGLIEAARDLGANARQIFRRVILPLSLPGILSGISMVFIPALSTFEITALLGGNRTNLIGNVIEQQFTVTGDWNYGSALSILLMIFLILSLIFTREEDAVKRSHGTPSVSQVLVQPEAAVTAGGEGGNE